MTTLTHPARPVKTAPRHSMPYTQADLDWAAQAFADAETDRENRHLEELAAEAKWLDQFNNSILTGRCVMCGNRCNDQTSQGLCDRCDTLATDASTACVNGAHGLGYRVF